MDIQKLEKVVREWGQAHQGTPALAALGGDSSLAASIPEEFRSAFDALRKDHGQMSREDEDTLAVMSGPDPWL